MGNISTFTVITAVLGLLCSPMMIYTLVYAADANVTSTYDNKSNIANATHFGDIDAFPGPHTFARLLLRQRLNFARKLQSITLQSQMHALEHQHEVVKKGELLIDQETESQLLSDDDPNRVSHTSGPKSMLEERVFSGNEAATSYTPDSAEHSISEASDIPDSFETLCPQFDVLIRSCNSPLDHKRTICYMISIPLAILFILYWVYRFKEEGLKLFVFDYEDFSDFSTDGYYSDAGSHYSDTQYSCSQCTDSFYSSDAGRSE